MSFRDRNFFWTWGCLPKANKGLQLKSRNPLLLLLVPEVGIEPTRGRPRGILSPVRLPISPLRHGVWLVPKKRAGCQAGFGWSELLLGFVKLPA